MYSVMADPGGRSRFVHFKLGAVQIALPRPITCTGLSHRALRHLDLLLPFRQAFGLSLRKFAANLEKTIYGFEPDFF
jgi:hypothetical protein